MYRAISRQRRAKIFKKLEKIDPEGLKKVRAIRHSLLRNKAAEKRLVKKLKKEEQDKIINNDVVAMAQEHWETKGITKFRFVQAREIQNIIAVLLGVGYSKEEVREHLGVDSELINSVTPEMVARQKKNFQEGIVLAADQKVYKDLIGGEISIQTERADKIAHRRRRLVLDHLGKNAPRGKGLLPSEIEEKQEEHRKHFDDGPEPIDVTLEEADEEKDEEKTEKN